MDPRTVDAASIEAEVDHVRSLGIDALRKRWRLMFGATPPKGLTKDIIARMIACRIQGEAFGGLDRETVKLLDRLARGGKPNGLNRRFKAGTVLVREYQGERHTVTVVPGGFLWQDSTYSSLSTIARAITGTAWNGPRRFPQSCASMESSIEAHRQPQDILLDRGRRSQKPVRGHRYRFRRF